MSSTRERLEEAMRAKFGGADEWRARNTPVPWPIATRFRFEGGYWEIQEISYAEWRGGYHFKLGCVTD